MSDEFDRDALFSDIDKIMEKQGYSNVLSSSSPVEVEATDVSKLDAVPAPPQELIDKIEQVVKPVTREDAKVTQASIRPEKPIMDTAPISPQPVAASQPVEVQPKPVEKSAVKPATQPAPAPEPKPEQKKPAKETVMPPDSEAAPMFTTIDNPSTWSMDSGVPEGVSEMHTEPDQPAVSYLEAASSSGTVVENVAFGDISVGVETESVEYSVGHPLLRLLRNILICVAAALILSLLITNFVAHHTSVDGSSMSTTLTDGDQLIVQQLSYYFHEPERFDIIVFPISTEDNYIKRIIGLPGETVQIRDGQVYINGSLLTEDRFGSDLMQDPGMAADTIYLQADEYFVLGDNRNASVDSRFPEVGLIHKKDIKGKAWLRFYPFGSFGFVK